MSRTVPILLYHRVGHLDGSFMDEYTVSPIAFLEQMGAIARWGWRPIALESLLEDDIRDQRTRPLVITFDDGFASNREHAWPVLERYRFPSATFVVTGHLGTYNYWDGPSRANYPLLGAADLAAADSQLMTFHAHSMTHSDLTFVVNDVDCLRQELGESRDCLSKMGLGGDIFAYPRGSWNWDLLEQVRKAGYVGACTSMEGLNSSRTNPFLLRRVEIRDSDVGWRFRLKVLSGRDLVRLPLSRPPEVSILGRWLRHKLRSDGKRNGLPS